MEDHLSNVGDDASAVELFTSVFLQVLNDLHDTEETASDTIPDMFEETNSDGASLDLGASLAQVYGGSPNLSERLREASGNDIEHIVNLCKILDESSGQHDGNQSALETLAGLLIEQADNEAALQAAINLSRELYNPDDPTLDDTLLGCRANIYADALAHRYWRGGNAEDLRESIRLCERAVDHAQAASILNLPAGTILKDEGANMHKINIQNTLAARLDESFQMTGSRADLVRSITIMEGLVVVHPDNEEAEARHAERLGNLAASLQRRYELDEDRAASPKDLNRAVDLSSVALALTGQNSPTRATALCTLANPLGAQAWRNRSVDDMDRVIELLREALQLVAAEPGSRHVEVSANLAMRLFQRWQMADVDASPELNEAIDIAAQALSSRSGNETIDTHLRNLLGLFYYARFESTQDWADAEAALTHHWTVLHNNNYAPVLRRVQAGRLIVRLCCATGQWEAAYQAASAALPLVPRLSSRAVATSDRQRLLSAQDVVGFGADAAAAALNSGHSGLEALRLLEMGRGSLAASIAELRADLAVLRTTHPDLASRFVALRHQLQDGSPPTHKYHHDTSTAFDALLQEIRQVDGFARFLQPPTGQDFLEAACHGPVVVLTVSVHRNVDALLIKPDGVRVLTLEVSLADLEQQLGQLGQLESTAHLEWLWTAVARPVLDALGLGQAASSGSATQPRVWWIPTGILTRFPLHAAGHHFAAVPDSVLDRVTSSYSLSVKALLDGQRRPCSALPPKNTALLVAMAYTPDYMPLPCAGSEIRAAKNCLEAQGFNCILLCDNAAQKPSVLDHLSSCQIFHFAGHAVEHQSDPSLSALVLQDKNGRMTVGCVFDLNLSQHNPFLAYLSACSTGQVTAPKFRDESIHLIGAYQLAGFRHVIGSLWSVHDGASAQMTAAVYAHLAADLTDKSVSRCLHEAAQQQRDMARQHSRYDGSDPQRVATLVSSSHSQHGEGKLEWVPFVHFGL